ncbi:hypothetical protein, partial [Anaplasma bovis]|uniref:hypothetical protein n=1 Tax=Anaplasma bovis TaxID=186733 RepID=UPI002FEEADA6
YSRVTQRTMAITSTACKLAFEFLALVRLAVVSHVHASENYEKRRTFVRVSTTRWWILVNS